jgi:SAM-dependent methyltransferase
VASQSLPTWWNTIDRLHGSLVHNRRVEVLTRHFVPLIPPNASLLDVGCGDGLLAASIAQRRSDVTISGIDIAAREHTHIPVRTFDGATIPLPDKVVDAVLLVDVLHHTADPLVLLREARRVARRLILLKDHTRNGFLAGQTLRVMDWIGNACHGVPLPYNYWTRDQWQRAIGELGLDVSSWKTELDLYPKPAKWVFERSLHFIAALGV